MPERTAWSKWEASLPNQPQAMRSTTFALYSLFALTICFYFKYISRSAMCRNVSSFWGLGPGFWLWCSVNFRGGALRFIMAAETTQKHFVIRRGNPLSLSALRCCGVAVVCLFSTFSCSSKIEGLGKVLRLGAMNNPSSAGSPGSSVGASRRQSIGSEGDRDIL